MTESYDATLPTDKDWVRFFAADNNSEGMFLADEEIQALINLSSKEQALIECLDNIIGQLSTPDVKIDWLPVSYAEARKGYEKKLARYEKKYGVSNGVTFGTVTVSNAWREDSLQTDGDYNEND